MGKVKLNKVAKFFTQNPQPLTPCRTPSILKKSLVYAVLEFL